VNGTFFTGLLATQRDRVRPYVMDIHGVRFCYEIGTSASTFRLNTRFLHSQMSNSNSVNGALFTRFPATQLYKVCSYARYIDRANQPGAFRLNARFLDHQTSDSNSVTWT